jgi:hypothetical protein
MCFGGGRQEWRDAGKDERGRLARTSLAASLDLIVALDKFRF